MSSAIKVVVKGKGRDQAITERGIVRDEEEQRSENRGLGNTTRGSMKG